MSERDRACLFVLFLWFSAFSLTAICGGAELDWLFRVLFAACLFMSFVLGFWHGIHVADATKKETSHA